MIISIPKMNTPVKLGIFILILRNFCSISNVFVINSTFENILFILGMSFLLLQIFTFELTKMQLFVYMFVVLLGMLNYIITSSTHIVFSIAVILALKDTDLTQVLKYIFKITLILLSIHMFVSFFIPNGTYSYYYDVLKFDFGFTHANTFAMYFTNLILLWLFFNFEDLSFKKIICVIGITLIVYLLSKSDISVGVILVTMILIKANKIAFIQKMTNVFSKYMIILSVAFTFGMMQLYSTGNWFAYLVDELMSARIRLGVYAKAHYGFTLFGQDLSGYDIQWTAEWRVSKVIFDNIYTYLTYNGGFIWLIVISVLFYKLATLKNVKINTFIIVWEIYALAEIGILNCLRLFPIIMISVLLSSKNIEKYDRRTDKLFKE